MRLEGEEEFCERLSAGTEIGGPHDGRPTRLLEQVGEDLLVADILLVGGGIDDRVEERPDVWRVSVHRCGCGR